MVSSFFAVDDAFQFVEQFLGAADAEGGYEYGAVVGQGMFDDLLQALAAGAAVSMQAIAVVLSSTRISARRGGTQGLRIGAPGAPCSPEKTIRVLASPGRYRTSTST